MSYNKRHGGPYDRGAADSHYRRGFDPHYFVEGTYNSPRIEMEDMSATEITAYTKGFNDNDEAGSFKEY